MLSIDPIARVIVTTTAATPTSSAFDTGLLLLTDDGFLAERRVRTFHSADEAAALLGLAMGLQLTHPNSAFALCYKSIAGITPMTLTEAQASAIKALNGNVYLTRGYTHRLLELGSTASGLRYFEPSLPE